jgi:hypothetical protein
MTIYVSHSTGFDFEKELYEPIHNGNFNEKFIFPHRKGNKQYFTKELFSSKKYDLVIAEVSFPSTGQGIELAYANIKKIPIICLYKKGFKYSKALTTISKKFIVYKNKKDLLEKIKNNL